MKNKKISRGEGEEGGERSFKTEEYMNANSILLFYYIYFVLV